MTAGDADERAVRNGQPDGASRTAGRPETETGTPETRRGGPATGPEDARTETEDRGTETGDRGTESASTGVDWRGWLLVGVVLVSLLAVPAAVVLRPPALPFRVAYLVLPLVPAVLLGATAVWAALRGRERRRRR